METELEKRLKETTFQPKSKLVVLALFSYGGLNPKTAELPLHIAANIPKGFDFGIINVSDDALIDRSRSKVLSDLAQKPDIDCIVMVDHDIDFKVEDFWGLAARALKLDALVGGLYSVRSRHQGTSTRFLTDQTNLVIGEDKLIEAEYLATGFLAIPKSAVLKVLAGNDNAPGLVKVQECPYLDGTPFWDFARPIVVPSTIWSKAGFKCEYLSEDWAWSARAAHHGVKRFAWAKPLIRHWGSYPYTMMESVRPAQVELPEVKP